jgi:aryl-alcohol dehydrogenase-like predicted oxidoreductase
MTQLGLGLIGIGRTWGVVPGEVPSEAEALRFLDAAWRLGLRYFDTAPSYGTSEERLGIFLRTLTPAERAEATVATKFGEHWDADAGAPFVDHTLDGLRRSLDRSRERLGGVDILQLHKTTPEVLASAPLEQAWEYAAGALRGVSVSDVESARIAIGQGYRLMQIPLNRTSAHFATVVREAEQVGVQVVTNRPFEMGAKPGPASFAYVLGELRDGVVLTGTRNADHLRANVEWFEEAQRMPRPVAR